MVSSCWLPKVECSPLPQTLQLLTAQEFLKGLHFQYLKKMVLHNVSKVEVTSKLGKASENFPNYTSIGNEQSTSRADSALLGLT